MKVEMPEQNTVLEFPDGTSADDVNKYIQAKYPNSDPIIPSGEAWYNPIRSAKAMGTRIASTFNGGVASIVNGLAGMNKMMDDLGTRRMKDLVTQGYKPDVNMLAAIDHQKISRDVFQPKLEASVNYFRENEIALKRAANKYGLNFVEETIGDTIGGFLPYSLEFMFGVPWAIGTGMAQAHEEGKDNLLWEGLKAGAHRYALGKIFHGMRNLPKWAAVPTTGTVFAADVYWQTGGDWRETAKAFGSGVFLSSVFPSKNRKVKAPEKELHQMSATEFAKKVEVDSEGRMFIKATGEEIPFTEFQKKQREHLTPEEWIAEGHENILRVANDRGLFIPDEALEGHGILRDIWGRNKEAMKAADVEAALKEGRFEDVPLEEFMKYKVEKELPSTDMPDNYFEGKKWGDYPQEVGKAKSNGEEFFLRKNEKGDVAAFNEMGEAVGVTMAENGSGTGTYVSKKYQQNGLGRALWNAYHEGKGGEALTGRIAATAEGKRLWESIYREKLEGRKRMAADSGMSTSVRVEDAKAEGREIAGIKVESADAEIRVQMSDGDILRVSDAIEKAVAKERQHYEPPVPHTVSEFSNILCLGDVARVIDTIAADKLSKDAVGGVKTLDSVRAEATELLKKNKVDIGELRVLSDMLKEAPAKVKAWMDFMVAANRELLNLRNKANHTGDLADLAAFQEHLMFTTEVTALLKGVSADSSRVLGSRRIQIDGNSIDPVAVKDGLVRFQGLKENDIGGLLDRVKKMRGTPIGNVILEYTNINILATPTVHQFNFLGNVVKPFLETGQTYAQAAFGRLMKGRKDFDNRVTLGEANAGAVGMLHAAQRVFLTEPFVGAKNIIKGTPEYLKGKKFTDILRDIIDAPEKFEQYLAETGIDPIINKGAEAAGGSSGAIRSAYLKETRGGKLFDRLVGDSTFGEVMWKSLDVLGAAGRDASYGLLTVIDRPFKEIHYHGMLAREVYRASLQKEFGSLAERKAWVEETTSQVEKYRKRENFTVKDKDQLNIVQHIDKLSLDAAREGTWQADLGEFGRSIEGVLANHPWAKILGVRFFKTPVNLLKEINANSPLALLQQKTWADLSGSNGIRAQTKAFAKQMTGGLIIFGAWSLVQNNIITGSHPPDQRNALLAAKIPEYAIKIGDKYYQYNRFDPYLIPLAVIADGVNAFRYLDADRGGDVASMLMLSLGNSIFNKTWATQLGDLFETIKEPKQNAFRWVKSIISPMLPASGMARFVNAQQDPLIRECESVLDIVRNVYMPKESRPALDWLGQEQEHDRRVGMKVTSPYEKEPIYREAARLGLSLQPISETISMSKGEVKLTPDEHWKLQKKLDDLNMKDFLDDFIKRPSYQSLSDDAKEMTIKKIVSLFHRRAQALYITEDAGIKDALISDTHHRVNMLTAPPSQDGDINDFIHPRRAKHLTR